MKKSVDSVDGDDMESWMVRVDNGVAKVTVDGLLVERVDCGDDDVPFHVEFSAAMLSGIADFVASGPVPWRLAVTSFGEFERDGGRCEITELCFHWDGLRSREPTLAIGARVESEFRDPAASVDQPLVRRDQHQVSDLLATIAALVSTSG